MDTSLLQSFAAWVAAYPLAAVLGALAAPLLLLIVVELTRILRRGKAPRAEPAAPAVEPESVVPAVEPERVAPALEPEDEAVSREPAATATVEPLAPAPAPPTPTPPVPPARLGERLRRTSDALVGRLGQLLGGRRVDDELIDELEMLLFSADLGVSTAQDLLDTVRKTATGGDASEVRRILHDAILEKLRRAEGDGGLRVDARPHVILVLGVNGSGKTTTIGKLAARHEAAGHRVILGAADTFRAAAIEQLQAWGERVGCEVIAGRAGGDPAAVAFDAVKAAVARKADVARSR
jgi:fused signal recognition particle receptor